MAIAILLPLLSSCGKSHTEYDPARTTELAEKADNGDLTEDEISEGLDLVELGIEKWDQIIDEAYSKAGNSQEFRKLQNSLFIEQNLDPMQDLVFRVTYQAQKFPDLKERGKEVESKYYEVKQKGRRY